MIKKNYIILAHNNPNQLLRLVNRLDDGSSYFYIHIDKKVNIDIFSELYNNQFVKIIDDKVSCIWGDFSIVQATINCMKQIVKDNNCYYTILLSGQCYPIVCNDKINAYLKKNSRFDHIDVRPLDILWSKNHYEERVNNYRINISNKRGDALLLPYFFDSDFKTNHINLFHLLKFSIKRKNLKPLLLYFKTFKKRKSKIKCQYGGSQWWAFKYETLNEVLLFISENKWFLDFHKYTHVPDEIFFQTIIIYLKEINNNIKIKNSITYVNWSRSNCKLPVLFNQADFNEIKLQIENDKLFARKFDINFCENILDILDNNTIDN